jgi:hypothetical protein
VENYNAFDAYSAPPVKVVDEAAELRAAFAPISHYEDATNNNGNNNNNNNNNSGGGGGGGGSGGGGGDDGLLRSSLYYKERAVRSATSCDFLSCGS